MLVHLCWLHYVVATVAQGTVILCRLQSFSRLLGGPIGCATLFHADSIAAPLYGVCSAYICCRNNVVLSEKAAKYIWKGLFPWQDQPGKTSQAELRQQARADPIRTMTQAWEARWKELHDQKSEQVTTYILRSTYIGTL